MASLSSLRESGDLAGQTETKSACIYWNARARQLVSRYGQDPVYASRTYALLSLAQGISAHIASQSDVVKKNEKFLPAIVNSGVSAASIHFLSSAFPGAVNHDESIQGVISDLKSSDLSSDKIEAVIKIGIDTASLVINRRAADGADQEVEVIPPEGPGCWISMEGRRPIRPYWGKVKTLCAGAIQQYVPGPPPNIQSSEFKAALREVRQISTKVTPAQEAIIQFWADGVGSATPTGHWNLIACNYLGKSEKSEAECATILALLNIAMFDAGVACWSTKYKYWLARPSQLDAKIPVRLRIPNFPSYFSGHSAFSSAASVVLTRFFGNESKALKTMAIQASESRVLCGIHYKFDCEAGLRVGREIGEHSVKTLASSQSLVQLLEGN